MTIFDSHIHLNDNSFQGREKAVWDEANAAGVTEGVTIGFDLESSQRAIELAERLPGMAASVGISPHDILAAPQNFAETLERLANHPDVVAIGECGLEYHYDAGPRDIQIDGLVRQIRLANELGKITVIHLREADDDFLNILSSTPPDSAILHCFTASKRVMEEAVSRGYFISFSGIVTFKNARDLHEIVKLVPPNRLLIETDAPYLAPVPFRGKPCEPGMLVETARRIAELRETGIDTIARITRENARIAFQIEG